MAFSSAVRIGLEVHAPYMSTGWQQACVTIMKHTSQCAFDGIFQIVSHTSMEVAFAMHMCTVHGDPKGSHIALYHSESRPSA